MDSVALAGKLILCSRLSWRCGTRAFRAHVWSAQIGAASKSERVS